jgi:hypothetical protein
MHLFRELLGGLVDQMLLARHLQLSNDRLPIDRLDHAVLSFPEGLELKGITLHVITYTLGHLILAASHSSSFSGEGDRRSHRVH